MPIPFVINHIAPPPVGTPGTFDVLVSWYSETPQPVSEGEILEGVAPGRIQVEVTNFAGWATDDKRMLYIETDMGERYPLESHNDPDLPPINVLRRPGGSTAGLYPGTICGHSMRGTDMSGNQLLTPTYTGGPGPTGTIDQTVEVYVSDGISSATLTFTVRIMHADLYYMDADKTFAPLAAEAARTGIVYIGPDADFSWAPPEQAPTATEGGVWHKTADDTGLAGGFNKSTFQDDTKWGSTFDSLLFYFKAGATFYFTSDDAVSNRGINNMMRTYFHGGAGGTERAKFSGRAAHGWSSVPLSRGFWRDNGTRYQGWKVIDIDFHISDYRVDDAEWREWWNIINISGLSGGPLIEHDGSTILNNGWLGEFLTDGAGNYTQIVKVEGNTLYCRHVATSLSPGFTMADYEANETIAVGDDDLRGPPGPGFADQATLTGMTSGATMTFEAAGSRQDRPKRTPANLFGFIPKLHGFLFDNVLQQGAASFSGTMSQGTVFSDTVIKNNWNYGFSNTFDTTFPTRISASGLVVIQPWGYDGSVRTFIGTTKSPDRNTFNVIDSNNDLVPNNVSHSATRFSYIEHLSLHYCQFRWFGGHSQSTTTGHQPLLRLCTNGSIDEGRVKVQFYGCGFLGGNSQVQFGLANSGPDINTATPDHIRIERCHIKSAYTSDINAPINSNMTNFVVRNCLIDATDTVNNVNELRWIILGGTNEDSIIDSDENWVEPLTEFCTFILGASGTPPKTIKGPMRSRERTHNASATTRTITLAYRNNAYAFDPSEVAGYTEDGLDIQALVDDLANFTPDFRPTAGATNAFGTATPPIWGTAAYGGALNGDLEGAARPASGASRGALEP